MVRVCRACGQVYRGLACQKCHPRHNKAKAICAVPGCPAIATYRGRCESHATALDRGRGNSSERGYDHAWQQVRSAYLTEHPMCALCGAAASDVHHRLAKAAGGSDEWENLQALCKSHHSQATRAENRQG